jgi:drug/metabolite transporter (DMT)-like permease
MRSHACELSGNVMTERASQASSSIVAPAAPQMAARDYGLIALQSMLWGSAFFFIALVGGEVQPITITALRLVPACLVLLVVIHVLGLRLPATWGAWGKMLLMSAFNNVVPFILIIHAQRDVSGGIAAIFNATAPLFAVFIAPLFVPEERWSWLRICGILTGIVGVAVLVGGAGAVKPMAAGLLLTAACCYASANVMTRLFFPGIPPFVIACAQMIASLVLAASAALLFEQPWRMAPPSERTWLAIAAMGILSSAFASLCHFTVLRRAGATNAMLVTIILPLTPIVLGSLLLGEQITVRQLIGGLIIAFALVIIDGRLFRALQPTSKSKVTPP